MWIVDFACQTFSTIVLGFVENPMAEFSACSKEVFGGLVDIGGGVLAVLKNSHTIMDFKVTLGLAHSIHMHLSHLSVDRVHDILREELIVVDDDLDVVSVAVENDAQPDEFLAKRIKRSY